MVEFWNWVQKNFKTAVCIGQSFSEYLSEPKKRKENTRKCCVSTGSEIGYRWRKFSSKEWSINLWAVRFALSTSQHNTTMSEQSLPIFPSPHQPPPTSGRLKRPRLSQEHKGSRVCCCAASLNLSMPPLALNRPSTSAQLGRGGCIWWRPQPTHPQKGDF